MIEQGEGIVQTTNSPVGGAVKTVEGKKILWAAMPVTVQLRSGAQKAILKTGRFFYWCPTSPQSV